MADAVASLMGVVGNVMTTIEGNATLMIFMVTGVVFGAISVVKALVGRY